MGLLSLPDLTQRVIFKTTLLVVSLIRFALELDIARRSTWLCKAASQGDLASVQYLQQGAFPLAKQNGMIMAASWGYLDIVEELMGQGARPSGFGSMEENALMVATRNGHIHVVRYLLREGANPNLIGYKGQPTAVTMATVVGNLHIVKELARRGGWLEGSMRWSCREGNASIVRELLDLGAAVNVADEYDITNLMYASSHGHEEVVRLLVSHGASVNWVVDQARGSPLSLAIQGGHAAVAHHLLLQGASIPSHATRVQARHLLIGAAMDPQMVDELIDWHPAHHDHVESQRQASPGVSGKQPPTTTSRRSSPKRASRPRPRASSRKLSSSKHLHRLWAWWLKLTDYHEAFIAA